MLVEKPPRNPKEGILSRAVVIKSVIQGLVVFAASFGAYYFLLESGAGAEVARAMGLCVIILANLFLVLVNSSNRDLIFTTLRRLKKDRVMRIVSIATLAGILAILYTPLSTVLKLSPLSAGQLLFALGIAMVSVLWYEIVKFFNRKRQSSPHN